MKRIIYFLSIVCIALIVNSCNDRDILDHKDGLSLPTVTDLESNISDSKDITLTWNIPSSGISDEFNRPLSVFIQVYKGTVREYQITLADEPTSWNYTLKDPDSEYRVVVKLYGKLKEASYGMSSEVYSLGQTVEVN